VAAAGPASNLTLAHVAAVALRLLPAAAPEAAGLRLLEPAATIVYAVLVINLLLAIFNMLPIPPLDGGTVLAGLLPERVAAGFGRLRPYGFVLLYVLMFSGGFSVVVGIPYRYMLSWLI
jgi:Zn-dependent protease